MKNPNMFMNVAELFAKESTCCRVKVGAVIVKKSRIISTGYNGVVPGATHCEDIFHGRPKTLTALADHHDFAKENEVHAEANAIAFAARNGVSLKKSTIFVTVSPCFQCAKLIVAAGIKKVIYKDLYDRENTLEFFEKNKVKTEQFLSTI